MSFRPLGWEPFGFSKRATRSFQPPRRRLCAFPTPRPGPRQRAPTTSEPRTTRSDLLARDTPPTRCGGRGWRGFGGRSGCCCINAGQSDGPCVCWKGVWGNRVAAGFAKHGSELPRVAFRGLTMSRARLWGGHLTHGFSFTFLLYPHFFASSLFQMSVNARRHRLYSCLGGLVGYDVIAHATSLLHTQKVASSSLASSTFFFFLPPPCP